MRILENQLGCIWDGLGMFSVPFREGFGEFAKMFKRNFEDMERFANLADNLQRNQSNYETIRQQAIKNCSGSRKADNS